MSYDPKSFAPLVFHTQRERFLQQQSTPTEFLEQCLNNIEAREDEVQAWVVLNTDEARAAARASTQRYQEGRPLSAIDGMPIGIKDVIETRDMPTEYGSPIFKGNAPGNDAASVQALRAAGAIIVGKTVTTELAFLDPGPTTNPYDPLRTPGGSSSGSAAAVAANMVPAALGTQVIGSILRPSSFCGVWGYKPTYGALTRGEALVYSQSHLGVHAGCVYDSWLVAQTISQREGGDPGYFGLYGNEHSLYAHPPRRLAVIHGAAWQHVDPETLAAFDDLLSHLRSVGVEIIDAGSNPLLNYLEGLLQDSMSLSIAICAWEQRARLENMVAKHADGLGPKLRELLTQAQGIHLDEHRLALLKRDIVDQAHRAVGSVADGLITLSANGPAPNAKEALQGPYPTGDVTFSSIGTILRAPAVNIPLLASQNLPVGVQLITQPNQDAALMSYAQWMAKSYLQK
ncbi:MAG TPA: amidase [Paenalcaligenes sp.]|nr:amidase [Paenalcaligenes sp.]